MTVKDPTVVGLPTQVDVLTDQDKSSPVKKKAEGMVVISSQQRKMMRKMPYLSSLTDAEFSTVLKHAKELTFQQGSIIMREGNIGRTFYVITEGEVEICQKTSMEDPLATPPTYLGTVINRLGDGDFFGERSLLTKEPRAASIRASSTLTKCLTFDKDDFPASCPLSGKAVHEADVDDANEKYGVALKDITTISNKQISDSVTANQTRGSVNRPGVITGVDTDDDLDIADTVLPNTPAAAAGAPSQLTQDQDDVSSMDLDLQSDAIIPLLMRFRLLRLVGRCFNYIKKNRLRVADVGGRRRRAMLVKRLLPSQHVEFTDAFTLIDADGDGSVTLKEMRKALDSIDESSISNEDLRQAFQDGDGSTNGSTNGNAVAATNGSSSTNGANGLELADDMEKETLRYADFMGIMAEADLYYLFRDTFQALDTRDSGFVRAKDLDRVLCGVRDLISDDRKSIIDVEDTEILIDYEQFSQMLLGKALS